ncbi:FHA domain-containing protein [Rhodoferax sp. TBRC 17198]|uniref:FHA domain-containing protein n=1 Tax=Rhodoferax potami TaxID=3068338 RepID=UPI0028BF5615|nr:FHA domain-containing protein [Rhodoferax sp. TBRC 17198]MDT7523142.1 FHA domain-containing protein [Rhodoferax sp. TBRC 17198]
MEEMTGSIELRVLAGLQAGARLTLAEGRHVLGSSEACDIVLVGPRIDPQAMEIVVEGMQLRLEPGQPGCGIAPGDSLSEPFMLAPGVPFHVGDIWLVVDHQNRAWPENHSWLVPSQGFMIPDVSVTGGTEEGQRELAPNLSSEVSAPSKRRLWLIGTGTSIVLFVLAGLASLVWIKFGREYLSNMRTLSMGSFFHPQLDPASKSVNLDASPSFAPPVAAVEPLPKPPSQELLLLPPAAAASIESVPDRPTLGFPLRNTHHALAHETDVPERPDRSATSAEGLTRLPFVVRQVACGNLSSITTENGIKFFEGASQMGYKLERVSADRLRLRGRHDVELPC